VSNRNIRDFLGGIYTKYQGHRMCPTTFGHCETHDDSVSIELLIKPKTTANPGNHWSAMERETGRTAYPLDFPEENPLPADNAAIQTSNLDPSNYGVPRKEADSIVWRAHTRDW
jgi:hypothetical protein